MTRAAISALACGLAFLLAGCASTPEEDVDAYDERFPVLTAALKKNGDPDSLAAAAIIRLGEDAGEGLALARKATDGAPDRADLAWLALSMCIEEQLCDPQPLEARLRALDPANGAAWLGSVTRAFQAKRSDRLAASLEGMAATDHVYTYWMPLLRRLIPAVERANRIASVDVSAAVTGGIAVHALPVYQAITQACKAETPGTPAMLEACRRVAGSLSRGDTYLTELMGLGMQRKLWPADSPQVATALEARRVANYQMTVAGELDGSGESLPPVAEYLRSIESCETEQQCFKMRISRAGQSVDPPVGWVGPVESQQ